jgi:hypothetical protein
VTKCKKEGVYRAFSCEGIEDDCKFCRYDNKTGVDLDIVSKNLCKLGLLKHKLEAMGIGGEIEGELVSCITTQLGDSVDMVSARSYAIMKDKESYRKSDLAFVVDGKEFKCHQSVLMAQSPVMQKMLTTEGMRETENNQIDRTGENTIDGIQAFLKFLYYQDLNEARKNMELAFELLRTAHYYEVTPLIETCVEIFKSAPKENFESSTLREIFLFACKASLEELRDFIGAAFVA